MSSSDNRSNDWRCTIDSNSGRYYYYNVVSGETTWTKPIELAEGIEREEILRKREEARVFFSEMENNIRLKLERKDPRSLRADSDDSSSRHTMGSSFSPSSSFGQHTSLRHYSYLHESKDTGNFMLGDEKDNTGDTNVRGRLVRTISSLDDEILAMSQNKSTEYDTFRHGHGINLSSSSILSKGKFESSKSSDDFLIGISSASPSRAGSYSRSGSNVSERDFSVSGDNCIDNSSSPSRSKTNIYSPGSAVKSARGSLRRSNSMSTIFVESTLVQPDSERTIKCVCAVLRMHMLEARASTPSSSLEFNVFSDNYDKDGIFPWSEAGPRVGPSQAESKTPDESKNEKLDDSIAGTEAAIPPLDVITDFFSVVFFKTQMESECIIIALIYCERFLKMTYGRLKICHNNWRSIIFASMIMSSKVWDDLSMWNVDFSNVFAGAFDLQRINQLELAMLYALKYYVKVSAGEYAKYYFHLRSMMARLGYHGKGGAVLVPLDIMSAQKLQLSTQRYQESTLPLRRSISVPDDMERMIHSINSTVIDSGWKRNNGDNSRRGSKVSGPPVFTERSALVGVEQIIGL
jgi:hypothetical protein